MRDEGGESADTRAQAVTQRALGPGRRSQRGRESGETRAAGKGGPRERFWAARRGKEKEQAGGEGSWASAWIPGAFSLFFIYFFSVSFSKVFPNRILKAQIISNQQKSAQNKICLGMNAKACC